MNLSNNELDELFENVRNEKPVASFDETQRKFLAATIATTGGVLATKSLLKLFTFKQWIIMISVLSAVTVGTLLVTMSATPMKEKEPKSVETNSGAVSALVKEDLDKQVGDERLVKLESLGAKLELLKESPDVMYREIVTQYGKPPVIVKAYLKNDGSYHFEYLISTETTEADLKELQEKAKEAGFELKYQSTFKEEKLQKLNLEIVQVKENGQRQNIQISDIELEENSPYKVAWNVDEKGTATTIACGEDYKSKDLDRLLADLDLEELTNNLDAVSSELVLVEASQIDRLAALEELVRVEELLADSQVRESLLELEEINEEIMEDIEDEIEEARELFEEEEEEIRRQCELLEKACEEHSDKCEKEEHQAILREMVSDGLVKSVEDRLRMQIKHGKMKVNGSEVPKKYQKKYKALIKKSFEIDPDQKDLKWTWIHDYD